jgi:cytochrome P450
MSEAAPSPVAGYNLPDHVPKNLVFDIDLYNLPQPMEDFQIAWSNVRKAAPGGIVWTPRNGGHWIVLRGAAVAEVQSDYKRFSNHHVMIPANTERAFPLLPLELDPPESLGFRRVILPPLMPNMLDALTAKIYVKANRLIDRFIDRGECEFVHDFASKLPIGVFLDMMELPAEDDEMLQPLGDAIVKSDSVEVRIDAQRKLEAYVLGWIHRRRDNPGDDLLSRIATADVDGRKMTDLEATSLGFLLMLGGLDTVVNMSGSFALYLARNPTHRRELVANPGLIKQANEELIRRCSVATAQRVVVADIQFCGAPLKAGDMIQAPNLFYGLDEDIVESPWIVDFHRQKPAHTAFGNGPHVCPGQHLARLELRIFLEEWLRRIPDFEIKPGTTPLVKAGMVGGPVKLELSWPVCK